MVRPSRTSIMLDAKTMVPGEPFIEFKDVRIGFDDGDVLRGVSFAVSPGETKVILGESGSGKTLIMKLAAGLLRADSGRVWVMGHHIGEMSEDELLDFRRHLGFVFQEGALFDSMDVAENVAFRLREERVADEEVDQRVREALRFVELENALERFPAELSGGMRRRVSIARALVDKPPLVFYDSPTAGLDPVTSQTIITLILRGRDLQGVTSLLATHRVQDAFGLAHYRFDEATKRVVPSGGGDDNASSAPKSANGYAATTNVLVLREGEVYFEGSTDDVLHSSDEYLKKFLASAE
ncbi:MAG TPA: ATP-binding cassette domain-containing protein [Candidatus Acidoferrales bacterium]|nr:ATP-binding cassette domain-containing protein [Candidatus Acidoferrales bacterium]